MSLICITPNKKIFQTRPIKDPAATSIMPPVFPTRYRRSGNRRQQLREEIKNSQAPYAVVIFGVADLIDI